MKGKNINMNGENKNSGKQRQNKDSFAKPGDESIVSGKSFFLSFGKTKKGPSNPLIESEKNKAEAKNKNDAQGRNNENKGDRQNGKGNQKNENQGKNNFKKGQNFNKKQQDKKPLEVKNENQQSENKGSQNDRNQHKKHHGNHSSRDKRDKNRKNPENNQKIANQVTENKQKAQEQHSQGADKNTERNNQAQKTADKQRMLRQKHKKEKFVPTAPEQPAKAEELLQPIVDKTGIISPSKIGISRNSKVGLGVGISEKNAIVGEEIRYIDKNRPLAEQIAEMSKPKVYKTEADGETVEVIGVRFREAGKVYYFAPCGNTVKKDEAVIVETARGIEYGFCAIPNRFVGVENIVPPLKPIIRIATKEDTEQYNGNKDLEISAAKVFREKVKELGLEMSLVYVEYTFDNSKLLFYFTADGRVDFRELIKELAQAFRTRIELRQIGVRDEAKIIGGLGICGRPVCCKSFLGEFSQVSIKMAKDQNLFINSSKISGTCGRFMCCIRYEDEVYQKEYEKTPKVDAIVETPEGRGVVVESNVLKGNCKVLLDNKEDALPQLFDSESLKVLGYLKKGESENEVSEEIKKLEE